MLGYKSIAGDKHTVLSENKSSELKIIILMWLFQLPILKVVRQILKHIIREKLQCGK